MQITLQKLKLTNFKGIRNIDIQLNGYTSIYGDNGTGKTTLFDAFSWLLFGKDSKDRKDFEIKTLDDNNKVIPEIDHEVEATIQVDDQTIVLKKVLRENWVKKRGSTTTELAGNETLCYWNDVPMKVTEFQAKIATIVDESLFKLLTNPLYFNTMLKWQDRRTVLFSMAGQVSDAEVLQAIERPHNVDQVYNLTQLLNQGKSILEIRKEYAAKRKKIKDELDAIPTRVDEAYKNMPDAEDYDSIEASIAKISDAIAELEKQKENDVKAAQAANEAILAKQAEKNNLKARLQSLRFDAASAKEQKLREIRREISSLVDEVGSLDVGINSKSSLLLNLESNIKNCQAANDALRAQWTEVNSRTLHIADDEITCPTCQQFFPPEKIKATTETLRANFQSKKQQDLSNIDAQGQHNKKHIQDLDETLKKTKDEILGMEARKESIHISIKNLKDQEAITASSEVLDTTEITELEAQINAFVIPEGTQFDFSQINSQINALDIDRTALKRRLFTKSLREDIQKRITELNRLESEYSQQLADLEAVEFVVEAFNKEKITLLTESVNNKFTSIRFKLFDQQINGGEVECCEALVNTNGSWVPFSGANTAGQINAGLDVINALCMHHNVFAPIFIDNRESVNTIKPTVSQVINLVVSKDKQLVINNQVTELKPLQA